MARIELPSAADQTALDGNIFATVESGKACMLPGKAGPFRWGAAACTGEDAP